MVITRLPVHLAGAVFRRSAFNMAAAQFSASRHEDDLIESKETSEPGPEWIQVTGPGPLDLL